MYSIWDKKPEEDDESPEDDGGLCTGTLLEAIEMACDQANINLI